FSFQTGNPARERPQGWIDVSPHLIDFAATAALLQHMDVVVSVDTATAHLAGALGLPVFILLIRGADWRWLRDRTDTPWYPSARLFRQAAPRDWEVPLLLLKEALVSLDGLIVNRT
ncbi:MAG: hypothetical protein JXQ84_02405, partial [Rhodospirillaceae bacterium]|nr:hypothetical protein [Rhodospirillaceae bacterium]